MTMTDAQTYLCIGPTCWGRGITEAEAIRKAKILGGRAWDKSYLVYLTDDPEIRVEGGGNICRDRHSDCLILIKAVKNGKEMPLSYVYKINAVKKDK